MQNDLEQLGILTLTPFGTISAGSGVSSFNLESFWFGCVLDTQVPLVAVSSGCTIAVTGFYPGGEQVPVATYAFAPKTLEDAPLVQAVLPSSFLGVKNITIGAANGAILTAETVIDLDNLVHCNHAQR